ncbi:hypothetical protein DOTSEDRAFT_74066 [Dothistroma septosporum NZE10]|uniref:Uncharacterized protein n=1 Tax=Dothistroma septosporum (strain NZE10 / CBS 128990) TaxID=675120 RepID=N1PGY5_DOTSN|nr:hypothetical protein DOTSEDRAFT_74066 [Dothistroma septosporum NZE10]
MQPTDARIETMAHRHLVLDHSVIRAGRRQTSLARRRTCRISPNMAFGRMSDQIISWQSSCLDHDMMAAWSAAAYHPGLLWLRPLRPATMRGAAQAHHRFRVSRIVLTGAMH